MRMYDILNKKKNNQQLTEEEIKFIIDSYTSSRIPDYQMSALLMAICINGMTKEETLNLTMSMVNSGETADLKEIKGTKVDKHSTGGVGDKTTLIISPIVASLGITVAKMSGRGLGYTGGTIDKLEAIPGFNTCLTKDDFIRIVNKAGICISSQSGNFVPADKKIYALRDVTATVDNISLIAASIMSKKIAAGADAILLDVKTGSGAFMKTVEDSIMLAEEMVEIGEATGKKTSALITSMDEPLGYNIGNALEIIEVIETLRGKGPKDLTYICIELSKYMLYLARKGELYECEKLAVESLKSGAAYNKFIEMVREQGGDTRYIDNPDMFKSSEIIHLIKSTETGYISQMDTEAIGTVSCILGAGRETEDDKIDYSAGIKIFAKTGDFIKEGENLAELHTNNKNKIAEAEEKYLKSLVFSKTKPVKNPLIYAYIDKNGLVKKEL